ncbi:MAG: hypothetical protein QM681_10450 [Novosphingobium sp.]
MSAALADIRFLDEKLSMARIDALNSLISFDLPLDALSVALQAFAWDWSEPPLARLDGGAVVAVLRRWTRGEITDADVEAWANLLEGREDVAFDATAATAIFDLANPELQGSLATVAPALIARF